MTDIPTDLVDIDVKGISAVFEEWCWSNFYEEILRQTASAMIQFSIQIWGGDRGLLSLIREKWWVMMNHADSSTYHNFSAS